MITVIYNRILDLIGEPAPIKADGSQPKVVFLLGQQELEKQRPLQKSQRIFA